jgi:hypothetical protein
MHLLEHCLAEQHLLPHHWQLSLHRSLLIARLLQQQALLLLTSYCWHPV